MICRYCCTDLERPVLERWDFYLPIAPPSQNTIGGNHGGTRFVYAKMRKEFAAALIIKKVGLDIPDAKGKRRVIVTRLYAPSRRGQVRDRANIVGGCKMLIDAMVEVGLLVDDAEQYLEDFYRQLPASDSGTRIELEELG